MMEKEIIIMSKKELERLKVIHKVIDKRIKQKDAANILSLSVRQIRRITKKVKIHGDIAIVHGNRGRSSKRKFPKEFKSGVIEIVKKKYYDFGPKFASEKLEEIDNKKVSRETLRQWMIEEGIWIPINSGIKVLFISGEKEKNVLERWFKQMAQYMTGLKVEVQRWF
jgi:hypothetical protein